jgi:hypothetical protein
MRCQKASALLYVYFYGEILSSASELFGNAPIAANSTAPHLVHDEPLSIFVAGHGS